MRRNLRRIRWIIVGAAAMVLCFLGSGCMLMMPGKSYKGPLPPLTDDQRALASRLRADVELLSNTIGPRNVWQPERYLWAASEIEKRLSGLGYELTRQEYQAAGHMSINLQATRVGSLRPQEIVVIGAHYDSVRGTVGANDNATGVAALLAIADAMKDVRPERTLRFVAFANEEPPFFQTDLMGSVVYARACRQRNENIIAMISFDGLGFYSDAPDSQKYPFPMNLIYPSTANFIGFVGNFGSLNLVKECTGLFRRHTQFPSEGGAAPESVTGVGWSDHWSFWQSGYKAIMVTDSLPFRYPHYHTTGDTSDKIDYDRLARVVEGLRRVTESLVRTESRGD